MSFSRRERYIRSFLDNVDPALKEQLESTHKLWHERMEVIVPVYAAHTPENIKLYGMAYNTGSTKEERDAYNRSMVKVWMAPIRHIKLYSEGVPIAYPSRERAAKIYFHIKNHVKTWSDLMATSMNMRTKAPPMEDFDIMLEFAQNLEQFLTFYYNSVNGGNVFKRPGMNRFAENEGRFHLQDSTYSKLRDGIFGMMTNRTERNDDPSARLVTTRTERQDNFNSDDEFSLASTVDRIRNQ